MTPVLNYETLGDRNNPALVLAHPLGMNLHVWDHLVEHLKDSFHILRFDLPGHGKSKPVAPEITALNETSIVDAVLNACDSAGIQQFHFVGTSIGGMLGQQLIINHRDRLLSAVLTNTGLVIGTREGWLRRQADVISSGLSNMAPTLVSRWFGKVFTATRPDQVVHWTEELSKVDDHSYGLLSAWIGERNFIGELTPLHHPTILIAGSDDMATPPSLLATLSLSLGNPPLLAMPDTGHVPSVEQPEQFTHHVKQFLATACR